MKKYFKIAFLSCLSSFMCACTSQPKIIYPSANNYRDSYLCDEQSINGKLTLSQMDQELLQGLGAIKKHEELNAVMRQSSLKVAASSESVESCLDNFKSGEIRFLKRLKIHQKQFSSLSGYKVSKNEQWAEIQQKITTLWAQDQSARMTMVSLLTKEQSGPAYWSQQLSKAHAFEVDRKSLDYLEKLLTKIDWVDKKRFGTRVSNHAWILIQHADQRPDMQAKVLKRMEPFISSGDLKPANYAFLWDRVAVNHNRKQRYGTQPIWECVDGILKLEPLENPESVNERRAGMGMGTVEAGLAEMQSNYCHKHN